MAAESQKKTEDQLASRQAFFHNANSAYSEFIYHWHFLPNYTFYQNRYQIYIFYQNSYQIFVKNVNLVAILVKNVNLVPILVKSVIW